MLQIITYTVLQAFNIVNKILVLLRRVMDHQAINFDVMGYFPRVGR
jgi:hypothetical protein